MKSSGGDRYEPGPYESLKRFALQLYAADGISAVCLSWQDNHNVDVTVLLAAAWSGAGGYMLSSADIAEASLSITPWRSGVVAPLRGVRRGLKEALGAVAPTEAAKLRQAVKKVELESEMIALATLADNCPRGEPYVNVETALRRSIEAVFVHFSGSVAVPASDVDLLVSAAAEIGSDRS